MSPQIKQELMLVLISGYSGLIFALCYDIIRIFRRIFKESVYRSIITDIIFWTISSIYMFNMFLKYNYGSPRYYAILSTILVMSLYEWFIGRKLVDKLSNPLKKIMKNSLKPLKKVRKMIRLVLVDRLIVLRKRVMKCHNQKDPTKPHKGQLEKTVAKDQKARRPKD